MSIDRADSHPKTLAYIVGTSLARTLVATRNVSARENILKFLVRLSAKSLQSQKS
jgi:hypothetical protein